MLLKSTNRDFSISGTIAMNNKTDNISKNIFSDIKFYPNPASKHFTIEVNESVNLLAITDINSKIMFEKVSPLKTETINIQGLQSGIYFIRIIKDSNIRVSKFIVK